MNLFRALDDAQQPEDQDQQQQSAKSDIHFKPPDLLLPSRTKFGAATFQSLRTRPDEGYGIILPIGKTPDLLDFPGLARK